MESNFKGLPKPILIKINPHPDDYDKPMTECDIDFSRGEFKEKKNNNMSSVDLEILTLKDKSTIKRRTSSKIKMMYSSLLQTISSVKISLKLRFVCTNIFSIHFFVMLITVCENSIQDYVNQFCWFQNVCNCNGNFQIKIYSSLIYILQFFNLLILTFYKTGVEICYRTSPLRNVIKYVFYFINFLCAFSYLLIVDEGDMFAAPIIIMIFLTSIIFQTKFLFDNNFQCWLIYLLKVNTIPILFFSHYLLCLYGFPQISSYFLKTLGNYFGKNFNSILYFLYFSSYSMIFPKLCCIYHNYTRSLGSNECFATMTLIRFSLVFSLSVPISSIINMDKNDWGCWILLISYIHFIISWYTRWDFFSYFLEKIIKKILPNPQSTNEINSKNELECKQLISGCLLDMVFIVNFRLMIITLYKRWLEYGVYTKYYKNCKFEISDLFEFSYLGAYSVFVINLIVTFGLLAYMIKTKKPLFEYIVTKNYSLNIYLLYEFHALFDGSLQLFYYILKKD